MNASITVRLARILRLVLPAILLAGCFGEGDGPERILGTPAPPPPPLPPGFCDPINFEDVCPAPGIANFAGGATTIVDHNTVVVGGNPIQGGINTSDQVAQMQKFADQPFGGTTITPNTPVTFGAGEAFTMKVWSPRAVPVLFKFEGLDRERSVGHSGSGTWEELCFDFTADTAGNPVTGITVIFDLGVNGEAATDPDNWTFFYDDITQVSSCPGAGPTTWSAITFDDPAISYTLSGFGGAEDSTVVADPTGGMNQVVQVNRAAGAEVFAGTTVATGLSNSVPTIPLDPASPQMTVRVYSPAAGVPVRLKVENANDSNVSVETEAITTVANTWETLTFDFSNEVGGTPAFSAGATYNRVIIFFNFGTAGAPAETYFFDDIDVGGGGGGPGPGMFSAITFDDPAVTYTLRGFGGAEDSTVVGDPTGGANQVVQVNRSDVAETFAGTVVSTGVNESIPPIPLDAANTQMSVRVYSPAAGIPVRLKIENSNDPAVSVETEATTTAANTWETLTFDFANEVSGTAAFDPAATYDKVVIFFNFGTDGATAGAQTYFFDDIDVGSGGGGPGPGPGFAPITFDDPAVTYALRGFGGAEDSTVITDPSDPANSVVQVNRSAAAETFAGTVVSTGPNESIPPIPLDAANTQMNVRVFSPAAGIPVRLKIENSTNPAVSVETESTTTAAGVWETLTFDFTNQVAGTAAFDPAAVYDKVVIFFNFGTDGATAGAQTFLFDDIDVGAGSGGPGPGPSFDPITFDDPAVTYTLRGFGGAEDSTVAGDPTGGGNMVVQVNRSAAAETFAGTVVSTGPNESIPVIPLDAANTLMNVRVYSPAAGIPVRLKIENSTNPAVSVETESTTTAAGVWETLTFDFTNQVAGTAAFDPAATYDKVVIFFNFGTDGATAGAQTFFFDDIDVGAGAGGPGPGPSFDPITFDDPAITYALRGFGGAEDSTVQADPTDPANNVVQVNRSAAAETFAGTVVSTGPNESIPVIPLDAANTTMNVRVYSPAAGIQVRLKIENSNDPAISVETEATTTVANTWEALTFDFANQAAGTAAFDPAATYDKVVIFFNFGTDGATAGAQTYFFDDIDVGAGAGGPGPGPSFDPITFDDPAITYALRGFGGAEDSTVQADPTDPANNVVQVNRSAAAETFAGTVVSTGPNESIPVIPLDAANTTMNVRVYSPAAGIQVRLKIENSNDPAISVETEATTTVANTWEALTFDFANQAAGTAAFDPAATYDKVVIFFNFGTDGATAGAQTYFFDDIDVGAGSGGGGGGTSPSQNFESGSATFLDFGGGVAAVVANPDSSGLNTSANVGQMQKFAGETFGGSTLDLGGSVALAAGDSYTMLVRSQRPVPVTFKLEPQGDERVANHSGSGTWELLCFDFTGVSGDITGYTIIFDNGVAGDAAGDPNNWTFQFDDIEQVSSCPSGGGPTFETITFDDPAVTYALRGFGGAEDSTVIQDPSDPANNVVQVNRSAAAETFAGTVVSTLPNEAIPAIPLDAANTEMNVRVNSPAAGIVVRLKIENSTNPGVSVETEATTTVAGSFEELTFDFANQVAGTAAFDPAATYDKVVIFFNFGTNGATAGAQTFLFDDIATGPGAGGGGGGASFDPITFDDPAVTYALRGFGGAEDSTVVTDPTDPTNNVAQVVRSAAAETFAGTVVSTGPNESIPVIPLDAQNTRMSVRVWSPVSGIQVRLKIENSNDPAVSVETEATSTVAAGWETLTFDFANEVAGPAFNPAATYDKVVVFPNFGVPGSTAGEQTYFFDDIDFVGGGGTGGGGGGGSANFVNGDFETGDFTGWVLTQIPDNTGSINLDSSGQGGRAGFVARLVASGSDVTGSNDVLISQVALAAGTVQPGDTIEVFFDLYGSLTGAGGVVFVEVIFLDAAGNDVGGRDFVGPAAPYFPTTAWTTYSGTVIAGTATGGGQFDVSGGVTLQLKAACGAIVGGCGVDASFDNVTFQIN